MNEEEKENNLINSLTKYLKYFKTSLHIQLSLIEAILSDSIQAMMLFAKIKANTYEIGI